MSRRNPPIAFVLGKPVREGSVFPEVFQYLRRFGVQSRVHLPHEAEDIIPAWLYEASLIVNRGLNASALSSLAPLEQAGLPCCNPVDASLAAQDRRRVLQQLSAAGLPVPPWTQVMSWSEVLDLAGEQPVVVKAIDGSRGRGAGVAFVGENDRTSEAPFPGPYILQKQVDHDGWDHKVYVAGHGCRGLLKPWPRRDAISVQPFEPESRMASLAGEVGQVLSLTVYGVDFLEAKTGPVIVDVNVFPGFRGVPQAARLISGHLYRRSLSGGR